MKAKADPFATLGIAPTFDVDLPAVEKVHRDLSRALHPDRYVGAAASERRESLARAVEVNEAWRIVRDPIRRAEALLALRGAAVSEERAAADPELLTDMLERREALADAKSARDLDAVRRLAQAVEAKAREAEGGLSRGFAAGEASEELLAGLDALRFYRRFLDEVSAIEDELAA